MAPIRNLMIPILLLGGAASAQAATIAVPRDYKSIQRAINAGRPGDTVVVQAGTYRETIRLSKGVTVRSAGDDTLGQSGLKRAEATIIDGGGSARGPGVILAEGAVLDGLSITRVGTFDEKEYDKHHATKGETLPDNRGAVGAGKNFAAVDLTGVTATVRFCIVHDNGHAGIGCSAKRKKRNRSRIIGNIVYRNMGGGIGIADGATPTVATNVCFNNLRAGIGNRNSAGLIVHNTCHDNVRAGIGIREAATPIVAGNTCFRNRRAGIGIRMADTSPLIEANACYGNALAGIGARDGASPVLRGNHCFQNALAGIGVREGATAQIITNTCFANKAAGIGAQQGARVWIGRNRCYENEEAGIGQRSDATSVIDGNQVYHNKKAGLGFDDCKAGVSFVSNNNVFDNERVAVGIHTGWNVHVTGNVLRRAAGLPPIVMVFQRAEAYFAGNTITGSGVAGIRVQGKVRVENNTFHCPSLRKVGPPQFAVWGLPGSVIHFRKNTVVGWRHALQADRATVVATKNRISGYWQAGIRLSRCTAPVVTGNIFQSAVEHPGVIITGDQGTVENNRVEKPTSRK